MKLPLQIAFHHLDRSEQIENLVREKAAWLDNCCDQIMGCRVVIDLPHKHHQSGNQYLVHIDITVPGEEIVVKREPPQHTVDKDISIALHEAFDSARRQLEDYMRRRRRDVKSHQDMPYGRVCRLFPDKGYGFIETSDRRELYFHSNSVLDEAYGHLQVGSEVAFAEEEGDKGPQASTVKLVDLRGHL
jgi:cold shock CspA family protein/ribosome-associated translation inhibitor RaiA